MYLTFGAILALLTFQGLVEDISTRTVRSKTEALEGPGIDIISNIEKCNNFVSIVLLSQTYRYIII